MTAADTETTEGTEIERIERWRAEALERAGYDPRMAAELASRTLPEDPDRVHLSRPLQLQDAVSVPRVPAAPGVRAAEEVLGREPQRSALMHV